MTDSPRLEEVFAAVLAEHVLGTDDDAVATCSCLFQPLGDDTFRAHVAERLAARFASDGYMIPGEPGSGFLANEDGVRRSARPTEWVPVFRLVGGDQ